MAEIWTALNQNSRFVHIFTKSCKREKLQPERLLRALLLQAFYTTRSETQLIEQLDYNLLYRWFVGLGVDEHGSSVLGLRFTFVSPIVSIRLHAGVARTTRTVTGACPRLGAQAAAGT